MLKKRIIPCFDVKEGRTVKGINFVALKDAGDPVELAKKYVENGADELVFLDITATLEKRETLYKLVEKIAQEINIPFTVGGGINSVETAKKVLDVGADKLSINSAAVLNPTLITELAGQFGNQCVVVAIDTKKVGDEWCVFINGGKVATELSTVEWAQEVERLGAGEILLTSMNRDGTKNGFDLEICNLVSNAVNIPVIASGGAGECVHFSDVFLKTKVSAALAASIFHFGEITIPALKQYLTTQNIPIR